jgi:uncharacterized protein (DUF1919 family)
MVYNTCYEQIVYKTFGMLYNSPLIKHMLLANYITALVCYITHMLYTVIQAHDI